MAAAVKQDGIAWTAIPLAIPLDGILGLDEAGRIWDEPTTTGCFVKKVFVFGGPRRHVAPVGRIELVDDIGSETLRKTSCFTLLGTIPSL